MEKSILVVDDDRRSLSSLAETLDRAGYTSTTINGEQGHEGQFDALRPDLIFISLDATDAIQLCAIIRDRPDGAIIPIIFITDKNNAQMSSPQDALAHGGDYFFSHPLEIDRVLEKVKTYLGAGVVSDTSPKGNNRAPGETPEVSRNTLADASDALLAKIEEQEAAMHAELKARERQEAEARKREETEARERQEAEARERKRERKREREREREEAEKREREEAETREREEAEARERQEAEAREREEAEKREREEAEARERQEAEAREREREREREEAEKREREEAEAREREEAEARERQEAEAREREEAEKREREEAEAREREEAEKREREEAEAREREEAEKREREEAEARERQEAEAREREEAEKREREEAEARERQEAEARERQEAEARKREEAEARERQEAKAREREEAEAREREEAEARRAKSFEPASGHFDGNCDIATLVYRVWAQQSTGRLRLTSHHHQKSLFFEEGQPVGASSSQTYDRMEEFLRRENKITRAQYQEVRIKGLHEPRRIVGYLATEGYLKAAEIFDLVQRHLESIVFSVFEFEEGDYGFSKERIDEDQRVMLSLSPRELITEGIRRKYLLPRLIERVGVPSSLIGPVPGATHDADSLGLTTSERQIWRLVDGTRNIEDLVFSTGLGAQRVYQVLASLLTTESAEVLVRGVEPGNPDGTATSDTIDRARIKDKYEKAKTEDYFSILGVSRKATSYEVQHAFERHWQDYSRSRFSEAICTELANELDEIEQVLQDARDILSDEMLRESYARHLSPR